jgi:hypothetical protein
MSTRPFTVRLARILVLVDALLWLAFAAYTTAGAHPSFGPGSGYQWPVTLLALLGAGVLGALALHLGKPSPLVFWLTVGFLAAMIVSSVFDQFGLADLVFVVAIASPLVLIVKDREWYLRAAATGGIGPGAG